MTKIFLMFAMASPVLFGFTAIPQATCPEPTNVTVVAKSGGNISFDWSDCTGGCTQYLVKYYRQEGNFQSQLYGTSASAYSFSGLPNGTYRFYFGTDCGGEVSGFVVLEEAIVN